MLALFLFFFFVAAIKKYLVITLRSPKKARKIKIKTRQKRLLIINANFYSFITETQKVIYYNCKRFFTGAADADHFDHCYKRRKNILPRHQAKAMIWWKERRLLEILWGGFWPYLDIFCFENLIKILKFRVFSLKKLPESVY